MTVQTSCARIVKRPYRNSLAMLMAVILLPVPSAFAPTQDVQAHQDRNSNLASSRGDDFSTDNLFRWSLRDNPIVTVETEYSPYAGQGLWGPIGGLQVRNQLRQWTSLFGFFPADDQGDRPGQFCCDGTEGERVVFNWTFNHTGGLPVTSLYIKYDCPTDATTSFNVTLIGTNGQAVVGPLPTTSQETFDYKSLGRNMVASVWLNGSLEDQAACYPTEFNVWSQGHPDDARLFVDPELELLDWVATREGTAATPAWMCGGVQQTIETCFNAISIPPGEGVLFVGGASTGSCVNVEQVNVFFPYDGLIVNVPGVDIQWLGPSNSSFSKHAFHINNTNPTNRNIRLTSTGNCNLISLFAITGSPEDYFGNEHNRAGTTLEYSNTAGVPLAATCSGASGCSSTNRYAAGIYYRKGTGPTQSFPFSSAAFSDTNFDIRNITWGTALTGGSDRTLFNVTLQRNQYFGNAVVWAIGAYMFTDALVDVPFNLSQAGLENRILCELVEGALEFFTAGTQFTDCTEVNAAVQTAFNTTNAQVLCDADTEIIVNGHPGVTPIFAAGYVPYNDENAWFSACFFIIDDFVKTEGLIFTPTAYPGYPPEIDNSRTGASRTYSLELVNFPRADSQFVGAQLYQPNTFPNKGAERIACTGGDVTGGNSPNAGNYCYMNSNTFNSVIPGAVVPVQWNWTVRDQQTDTAINQADIFDAFDSVGASTNATGNAIVNTTTGIVQWSLQSTGYNPLRIDFVGLSVQYVNIQANMSRWANRTYTAVTDGQGNAGCRLNETNPYAIDCYLDATGDISQTCTELYGGDGHCAEGPIFNSNFKLVTLGCPADASTSSLKPLQNVSATIVGDGKTISTLFGSTSFGGGIPPINCLLFSTPEIQSSTLNFTFSKAGYRTLRLAGSWFNNAYIRVAPEMKTGNGNATNVVLEIQNTTFVIGGVVRNASFIIVRDNGAATTSTVVGPPSAASGLTDLANNLGFFDSAGKIILALAVMIGIFLLLRNAPIFVIGLMEILVFFMFAFLGFFDSWLVFLVIMLIVGFGGLGFLAIRSRVSSSPEEGM